MYRTAVKRIESELDAPNVSAVREQVVEVEIIESDYQKRIDEAAAEDFFANGN